MDFNTLAFPCFFAAAALLYYCLPRVLRPALLLAASYLFYLWNPQNRALAGVLLGATLVTWLCGLALGRLANPWLRRAVLAVGCVFCLGGLFYFKYYNFFGQLLGGSGFVALKLAAPLGLSYFSFQSLGYVIDCYRGKYPPVKNPIHYALFVSFFPCIFTGPIEHADHLIPQFSGKGRPWVNYDDISGGAFRMLWGYFKKMVLADHLAVFVKAYYSGAIAAGGPTQLLAAALFSLQLYFDFSGCCDIAIGGARLFGIRLLENFDNPFLATSYNDLWKRWHKSLTGWFREYLYFSLGGSRCPVWRWALNFMAVFVFSGLWHGAAVEYLWWGILCGVLVLAERLPQRLKKEFSSAAGGKHAPAAASAPTPAKPAAGGRQLRTAAAHRTGQARSHAAPAAAKESSVLPTIGRFALNWLLRIVVFLEFSFCFIFFAASLYQAKDPAGCYTVLLSGWNAAGLLAARTALELNGFTGALAKVLVVGSLAVFAVESRGNVADWIRRQWFIIRWPLYLLLAAALLFFGVFGQSAFIYQLY
ncbi:MAG: MBOAT family protein [Faecalibacterium sp.]|nr:MBOAT family protein [Faecalibacterium sp.]